MRLTPALLAALLLAAPAAFAQKTLLHCGRLLDVRSGKLLSQQTIVVEKDRITAVAGRLHRRQRPAG